MRLLLRNVRVVDARTDHRADVLVVDGRIEAVEAPGSLATEAAELLLFPGEEEVLMPAFVELHAHFRDPGYPAKETLESGALAAAAGGYGTVVCMANTAPAMDDPAAAAALKARSDALGLIDLYPALSLTVGQGGTDLGGLQALETAKPEVRAAVRLLSEDGKDVVDDEVLRAAFRWAGKLGLPVSCHCDAGGPEAAAARASGAGRRVVSRIEEDRGTERALSLAAEAGARVHIAHVSTVASLNAVRRAKAVAGDRVTCEVCPHHLALTEADAEALGAESFGRVNPSLRTEEDRRAVVAAVLDGTADAIATDHAPHTEADKAAGAPGFVGLETAFAVCRTVLVDPRGTDLGGTDLRSLSRLMSLAPARILGLQDRGLVAPGLRADLVLIAPEEEWTVEALRFKSRGRNTPYQGRQLRGAIRTTFHAGRIVYDSGVWK